MDVSPELRRIAPGVEPAGPRESAVRRPSWTVIIPAYNEERTLESVVRETIEVLRELTGDFVVLVVDDGSTDATPEVCSRLAETHPCLRVIRHRANQGIGGAIRSGYRRAGTDFVALLPADFQFDPKDLVRSIPLLSRADIVAFYRSDRKDSWYRMLLTRGHRLLLRALFGVSIRDINWVKVYRGWVLKMAQFRSDSPFIETEVVLEGLKRGARLVEVEAPYYPRLAGEAKGGSASHLFATLRDLIRLWRGLAGIDASLWPRTGPRKTE